MGKGHISLHRCLIDSDLWKQKPTICKLFIHLLLKANHKDVKKDGKIFKRGEHITSYENLMRETNMGRETIWSALKYLKENEYIEIFPTKGCTHVKIVNYEKYQR